MKVFLLIAFCIFGVQAVWRGCGDVCMNNNDCDAPLCSKCNAVPPAPGKCVSGGTCNATCMLDSDCERLRYCYECFNPLHSGGHCIPGPAYPAQCGECKDDSQCSPVHACKKCLPDSSVTSGHRCAAGCNGKCSNDYDCGYGTECSRCDQLSKTCQKGQQCGDVCGTDGDCDSAGNCKSCIDFICSVPCNSTCSVHSDCMTPVTGCGICQDGKCAPGVTCGSRCIYDRDCAATGSCPTCFNSTCVSASACGKQCSKVGDCEAGDCPSCFQGKCAVPQCGVVCTNSYDCRGAGDCVSCTNGFCLKPQCGSQCGRDSDCASPCNRCMHGICTKPQCQSPCAEDNDCDQATNCSVCLNGKCDYKLPWKCGILQHCTPGNNNECNDTTTSCSRCDPFTATCRLGGPCEAACIVNTDCNQLSPCKICLNICTDSYGIERAAEKFGKHLTLEELREKDLEERKKFKA